MRPVLEVVPGISHLAERAKRFLRGNPGAEIGGPLSERTGCVVVSGKSREVTAGTLEELLDKMDRLAALEAERVTLQADYPGRRVWLSGGYRWYATRLGADAQWHVLEDDAFRSREMTLDADDEEGLRALLAAERGA